MGKKVWRATCKNQSYAQAVKYGNRAHSRSRVRVNAINVEETPKEWLKHCYIGRVSDLSKVEDLNESFILGGYNFIKIKILGGFHVLLMGEDKNKVKKWFKNLFDTIVPWEDQFVVVDKLVWV